MPSVITEPRDTTHLSHEMRRLKSLAQDAIGDGIYTTKRAMKAARRRVEQLRDVKEAAIYRVKRQPVQAVGAAFGIGVAFGLIAAWGVSRARRRA